MSSFCSGHVVFDAAADEIRGEVRKSHLTNLGFYRFCTGRPHWDHLRTTLTIVGAYLSPLGSWRSLLPLCWYKSEVTILFVPAIRLFFYDALPWSNFKQGQRDTHCFKVDREFSFDSLQAQTSYCHEEFWHETMLSLFATLSNLTQNCGSETCRAHGRYPARYFR